jgi:hypothetical protein
MVKAKMAGDHRRPACNLCQAMQFFDAKDKPTGPLASYGINKVPISLREMISTESTTNDTPLTPRPTSP